MITIALDLGIPNFTVFQLKLPVAEHDAKGMSGMVAEAVHVLLDEVAAFMISMNYEESVIVTTYATVLVCFKGLVNETYRDEKQDEEEPPRSTVGLDTTIKTFVGTFKLPMAFINETQDKVVTAATYVQRMPPVRRLELSYTKMPEVQPADVAKVIRQFRNKGLHHQPNPLYVVVYDQKGRASGTIPLGTNFKNKLLNMIYKKADHFDSNGYWVGEGGGASGILPVCSSTGRIALAWRSSYVAEGDCWGTIGGAIIKGKSPEESAKKELAEETGYKGSIKLHPAFVFQSGTFKYYNYIGEVPTEFGLRPMAGSSAGIDFADENDTLKWFTYDEIAADMQANSGEYHSGLLSLFKQSKDLIQKICHAASNDR
jgi:8-oxo-dGTP pyrophosphatase MutT (NUDIX family)